MSIKERRNPGRKRRKTRTRTMRKRTKRRKKTRMRRTTQERRKATGVREKTTTVLIPNQTRTGNVPESKYLTFFVKRQS